MINTITVDGKLIIIEIVIHLGINPINGGTPLRDMSITDILIVERGGFSGVLV
jgi:hypothetical protein